MEYQPKRDIRDIVKEMDRVNIGSGKDKTDKTWNGIVLALQRFRERMISMVGSHKDYMKFIADACKYYGKSLFLKLHPFRQFEKCRKEYNYVFEIAQKYGCEIGSVSHKVFDNCKFVLLYNSMTSIDCFIRAIPVIQFAPGAFYNTGAVDYTNRQFVSKYTGNRNIGYQLANFLIWKYYFSACLSDKQLCSLVKLFASNKDTYFPLPEKYSYAETWHYYQKGKGE